MLSIAGFSKFPDDITHIAPCDEITHWFNNCRIDDALSYYGLDSDDEFMRLFNIAYQRVLRSPELQCAVYTIAEYITNDNTPPAWDLFERATVDMLPAVIILCEHQRHVENMRRKGFDDVQIEFNRREMRNTITKAMRIYNAPGVLMSEMIWAGILIRANLVEFGRMQYETKTAGENYICDGIAIGDNVIGVHIPRGEPLTPQSVTQSIAAARKHFGKVPFVCNSWLLGAQLGKHINPDGNIARFREHFRIIKNMNSESIYHFLFNSPDDNPDISTLPADTSLRKSVRDALLSDTRFYDAIGVLLG